ncbi:MAG: hypothetical protein WAQ33_16870 [Gaiellaceae bacterium]
MHKHAKLLMVALTAAIALSLGAATANAARSFSATNNTLLTYVSPALSFRGGELQVICAVTLTASLHSTAAKTRGTLIGFINGGRTERCRNSLGTGGTVGIALVSHRSPWHLKLASFRGTLPRITEILFTIELPEFLIGANEPFGGFLGCLYRGRELGVETTGRTGAAEYTVERLRPQRNSSALSSEVLNTSIISCPAAGELVGEFTATLPPVIRLI